MSAPNPACGARLGRPRFTSSAAQCSAERTPVSVLRSILAALAVLVLTGCQSPLQVKVDAISDPGRPAGPAYRLVMRDPPAGRAEHLLPMAVEQVKSALAARGLHECPAGVAPDVVIVCEYGVGPGHTKMEYQPRDMLTIDYWGTLPPNGGATPVLVFDKYLKLTARAASPESAPAAHGESGPELWSVHLTIEDRRDELAPYLPLLARASIDYIGTNPGEERTVELSHPGPQ